MKNHPNDFIEAINQNNTILAVEIFKTSNRKFDILRISIETFGPSKTEEIIRLLEENGAKKELVKILIW